MASIFGQTGVADSGGLGEMLRQQLGDESEEQRKRRLLEQQQQGFGLGAQLSPRSSLALSGGLGAMLGGLGGVVVGGLPGRGY
jgi:hypothetical protein